MLRRTTTSPKGHFADSVDDGPLRLLICAFPQFLLHPWIEVLNLFFWELRSCCRIEGNGKAFPGLHFLYICCSAVWCQQSKEFPVVVGLEKLSIKLPPFFCKLVLHFQECNLKWMKSKYYTLNSNMSWTWKYIWLEMIPSTKLNDTTERLWKQFAHIFLKHISEETMKIII